MIDQIEQQQALFASAYADAQQRAAEAGPKFSISHLSVREITRRLPLPADRVLGEWFDEEYKEASRMLGHLQPWMSDAEGMTQYLMDALSVTTGDGCMASQLIQAAAGRKFGGEAIASGAVARRLAEFNAERRDALDDWTTAVYDNTQASLSAAGIESLILFRGIRLANLPAASLGAADLRMQPLSSFSYDFDKAKPFAIDGMVLAQVPVSRVWSSALSGPGRKASSEVLVTGGAAEAYLLSGHAEASPRSGSFDYDLPEMLALCVARGRDHLPFLELEP